MTKFESTLKITRTIRSEQVLNACVELVRKSLPLDLKKTWIAVDDIDLRYLPAYFLPIYCIIFLAGTPARLASNPHPNIIPKQSLSRR